MRWQLKDREVREKAWPDYTFGCKRVLFSSYFLPALQRVNVELVTEPIARDRARGARHRRRRAARGRLHHLGDRVSRPTTSCSRWRSRAADGATLQRALGRRRARPPRHLRARLPEHVRDVRAQHEHLGRLDHLLPGDPGRLRAPGAGAAARPRGAGRSRCAPRSRRRATARCRRASPARRGRSATPGTATSRAGSSPTGPATCASTSSRPRQLDAERVPLHRPPRPRAARARLDDKERVSCTTT